MEKTIRILNELEEKGIIKRYAIGGGMAVLFYAEPVLTYDLDVFCFLPEEEGTLISLAPIYDYLKDKGYETEEEHINIEGIPVQFIAAYNDLIAEALSNVVEMQYKGVTTKVIRVEHLLAIMLQTFRPKDRERIWLLLEEAEINDSDLEAILKRHDLFEKWHKFKERYDEK